MTFIPQKGTPLQNIAQPVDYTDELKAIAVMRLAHPDVLIPASLDVEGTGGLKSRVAAGASVITSIVPPDIGLAGVAQPEFDINDGHRSIDYVRNLAESLGRREATMKEFWDYYESHRPEATLRC
jgi:methylornithine synthase